MSPTLESGPRTQREPWNDNDFQQMSAPVSVGLGQDWKTVGLEGQREELERDLRNEVSGTATAYVASQTLNTTVLKTDPSVTVTGHNGLSINDAATQAGAQAREEVRRQVGPDMNQDVVLRLEAQAAQEAMHYASGIEAERQRSFADFEAHQEELQGANADPLAESLITGVTEETEQPLGNELVIGSEQKTPLAETEVVQVAQVERRERLDDIHLINNDLADDQLATKATQQNLDNQAVAGAHGPTAARGGAKVESRVDAVKRYMEKSISVDGVDVATRNDRGEVNIIDHNRFKRALAATNHNARIEVAEGRVTDAATAMEDRLDFNPPSGRKIA